MHRASPPSRTIHVRVNRDSVAVPEGAMASAAFLLAGVPCRSSVTGEARTAVCGMGVCFECRAIVDGVAHRRTCQIACREGMRLETQT
jgi:sarcosine oxidase subunit alpha